MRHLVLLAVLVLAAAAPLAAEDIPLIDPADPAKGWGFGNGPEFPGAKGSLEADATVQKDGKPSLRLIGDLTGGGNYVQMGRELGALNLDLETLSYWLKAPGMTGATMRLIDGSGQCHQIALKLDPPSDDWRLITFPVERFFTKQGTPEAVQGIARYESWGGAKDGKWHGNLKGMYLLCGRPKQSSTIWISGLVASVRAGSVGWSCDFEKDAGLPAGWTSEGAVTVAGDAFAGAHALVLKRDQANRDKPCTAVSPAFPVAPGSWELSCAVAVDLESPDASYNGTVTLETLDGAGKVAERIDLADPYGSKPWAVVRKQITIPRGVGSARINVHLNKTIGSFRVDALVAKPIDVGRKPMAVDRIVFDSHILGNLWKPEDPRTFTITVESIRPLADSERVLTWAVADYWGAEQAAAATVTVADKGKNKERFRYEATVDLAAIPLEVGRYYEIRAQVPLADNDPYRNWSSFAILPVAPAKAYRPDQIPFTSRNWDNRMPDYLRLADRLGVRIGGLWGRASPKPPHDPSASCIEVCQELGMGLLVGNPANINAIEHHDKGYEAWLDEDAIRGALHAWFGKFGGYKAGPIIIDLGNEPHCVGDQVKEVARTYKIAYDQIKKENPAAIVVATSVEPNEEYFKNGYGEACDVFDFHVYEGPENIREAIKAYQALMKKYNCVKPIWSTEIGLNAQGMTRQHIAGDMILKHAAFFAAGGANISWFDYFYPDPDAKIFGTSGDAFNMFDARYVKYAARLDAITYYNLINGILVKKVVDEKSWDDGMHGTLFRDDDGKCFALLWKDKGRADIQLPLAGAKAVRLVRIDGRISQLDAGGSGVGLSLAVDPIMIAYDGPATLPDKLATPALRIAEAPARLVRGTPGSIVVETAADPKLVSVVAPPGWTVERAKEAPLRFTVVSPVDSAVREGELLVRLATADGGIAADLGCRPAITGRLSVDIRPVPAAAGGKPAAQLVVRNLSDKPQSVTWSLALTGERAVAAGQYAAAEKTSAFLAEAGNGSLSVPANASASVTVPIGGADPLKVYLASASITDAGGSLITSERALAGFIAVPRAGKIAVDGVLDEPAWSQAVPCLLATEPQYLTMDKNKPWKGVDDLSAKLRWLWDDGFLYIGVEVSDDVFANTKANGDIWAGDGLQFLFDPKREMNEKPGKYDMGMALGTKGPQAWCWLSAAAATPTGALKDVQVAVKRGARGDAVYEVAIPWSRLAPFEPGPGADLGATMIVNEDDGAGRKSFIGWFGNPHTKQIDTVGDLVLMGE